MGNGNKRLGAYLSKFLHFVAVQTLPNGTTSKIEAIEISTIKAAWQPVSVKATRGISIEESRHKQINQLTPEQFRDWRLILNFALVIERLCLTRNCFKEEIFQCKAASVTVKYLRRYSNHWPGKRVSCFCSFRSLRAALNSCTCSVNSATVSFRWDSSWDLAGESRACKPEMIS